MTPKKPKFKENTLRYWANFYATHITEEEEILKQDMTETLNEELEQHIIEGEIIKIAIVAKPRLGKSTVGIERGSFVFDLLKKHKQRSNKETFGMINIARDQQERSKILRNPKTQFTVLVTDEENELENTGENVSVERSFSRTMSDVQAGRYIHDIQISPKTITDPNTDIVLEAIAQDKPTHTTHCKLSYLIFRDGQTYWQTVGHVNIYVGHIIRNWENIKGDFFELKRLETEETLTKKQEERQTELRKHILKWAKKDFYIEYMIKKYEKMELITKEGILRPRELDYAEIVLNTINKLKALTRINGVVKQNIIRSYIEMGFREAKMPLSIVGREFATNKAMGILDLYKSRVKIKADIQKIKNEYIKEVRQVKQKVQKTAKKRKTPEGLLDQAQQIQQQTKLEKELEGGVRVANIELNKKEEILTEMLDQITEAINIQENELKHYKQINEKYHAQLK